MLEISITLEDRVLNARKAVDAYRTAHAKLYEGVWHKDIPDNHTPLLKKMKEQFNLQGFDCFDKFWGASDLVNILELGFLSKEDFEARATKADREALDGMWH